MRPTDPCSSSDQLETSNFKKRGDDKSIAPVFRDIHREGSLEQSFRKACKKKMFEKFKNTSPNIISIEKSSLNKGFLKFVRFIYSYIYIYVYLFRIDDQITIYTVYIRHQYVMIMRYIIENIYISALFPGGKRNCLKVPRAKKFSCVTPRVDTSLSHRSTAPWFKG